MSERQTYDVVVCGAGLAGLTFARQLKMQMPTIDIILFDKSEGPFPDACHKVGESSVEGATHWLTQTLELKEYLDEVHLPKLGLRFFGGEGDKPFNERFEFGAIDFPPVPSVQLDRGVLENDLRELVKSMGVEIKSGCTIHDIVINKENTPHEVVYSHSGSETQKLTCQGNWVIDALGWRRFLTRKLKIAEPSKHKASSCWWRIKGKVDFSDIVSGDSGWENRVNQPRWYSTNHIMGDGYWIWFIPLGSGNTSIGIVSDENIHPIRDRSTYNKSMSWLEEHQPKVAEFLRNHPPMDFLSMKEFAHTSQQFFSEDRWATVGTSGAFTDPLYSMGSDLIAWASSIAVELIKADHSQNLSKKMVRTYNQIFRSFVDDVTNWYANMYPSFGHDQVMISKIMWDGFSYFTFPAQVLIHRYIEDLELLEEYNKRAQRLYKLNIKVQKLFRDWSKMSERKRVPSKFYAPVRDCPSLRCMVLDHNTTQPRLFKDHLAYLDESIENLSQYAVTIFIKALEDVAPEKIYKEHSLEKVNPWEMDLTEACSGNLPIDPDFKPSKIETFNNQVTAFFGKSTSTKKAEKPLSSNISFLA